MIFTTITEASFRKFADKSPYKSFMQTPEIAHLRQKNGWTSYYFGVKDKNKLIAAAMVVAKPAFLGKSIFYSPGGPLLDFDDTRLVNFFFKNLKKYAKSHNGYVLQIDPYYELIERDINGHIVADGYNHKTTLQTLKSLGFRPIKHPPQPKYLFVLDIKNRSSDELFSSFKQNTRNLISRTSRKGIKIRELKREDLKDFKKITAATSKRRNFTDRDLSYYEGMYDLFHEKGEVKFIVAEIGSREDKHIVSKTVRDNGSGLSEEPRNDGRDEASRGNYVLSSNVILSAAMFVTYGDEVIYLFSGSDQKYMKEYNAQYAIQWHMIKYAADHGYKTYNFYGIQGLPDPKAKDYGVYRFKKGFGGRVVELIGSFELPLSPLYYLHALISKLRH